MSMWLSSTEPSITLWGGEGGGGAALGRGRRRSPTPSGGTVALAASYSDFSAAGAIPVAAEAETDFFIDGDAGLSSFPPCPNSDYGNGDGCGDGDGDSDRERRVVGVGEDACLLRGPVGVIRGQPGVVRHVVLNNR